jgi:UDP-glucose 4-epimerase
MKVIITGGAGFIGSHVTDAFFNFGASVTVLDNLSTGRIENLEHIKNSIDFVECDISNPTGWEEKFKDADIVIHLAALADIVPSMQNPSSYYSANVTGTFNVLEAARKFHVSKVVYSASSSCYGMANIFPTPEDAPIAPEYPYALTKRMGEELVIHWNKVYGIPSVSLRFFNVYGTRSRTSGTYGAMFGVFLAQKLAGKPFTVVGDGEQTRDFTYVTDVANAVMEAALSDVSGEIMNVGSGQTVSVNRIVELLEGKVTYIPKRPGEPDCTFADTAKISSTLNWSPSVSLDNGVQKVLDNIDYWRDAVVWTPNTINEATKDWFKFLSKQNEPN